MKNFTFIFTSVTSVTVRAANEEQARKRIGKRFAKDDLIDCIGGSYPNGDMAMIEVMRIEDLELLQIDGKDVKQNE